METIQQKIAGLNEKLKNLKIDEKLAFDSVKKDRDSWPHIGLKDTAVQIMCLIKGRTYEKYSDLFNVTQAQRWVKADSNNSGFEDLGFCYIYDKSGYGSPTGFIAPEDKLYAAVDHEVDKIWMYAVVESREKRSLKEFEEQLKTDVHFLIKAYENYSGINFIEYENKKLGIKKVYIHCKD